MRRDACNGRAWVVVALLHAFMLINFADKVVLGVVAVPLMKELSISARQFGLLGSSFFLLFSLSGILVGFAADRIKTKWILALLGLVWSLVQFPIVWAASLPVLLVSRTLLGAGEGPAYPVSLHACYKWFPDERRNVPTAIIQNGAVSGKVIAAPLLTYVTLSWGWRSAFLWLGIIALVWVFLWMVAGAEGWSPKRIRATSATVCERVPYRHLLLNRTIIGSICLGFVAFWGTALSYTWFPAYLIQALGYSKVTTGWLFSAIISAQFPILLLVSWLSQYMLRRGVSSRFARGAFAAGGCIVGGAAMLLAMLATDSNAVKILLIAVGLAFALVILTMGPAIVGEIAPPAQRGSLLAINNSVATLGGLLAPTIMGSVVQAAAHDRGLGYEHGFVITGAVFIAGGLIGGLLLNPALTKARLERCREADARGPAGGTEPAPSA